jgi:hypothetical protein
MKEENKDLPDAQNKLRELREEMVGMNNSLAVDEAGLWDYKRSITSTALNLRVSRFVPRFHRNPAHGAEGDRY